MTRPLQVSRHMQIRRPLHVRLDALLPGIDIPSGSHQQLLIEVDGDTILVRTELDSDDAEGALNGVIESLQFP